MFKKSKQIIKIKNLIKSSITGIFGGVLGFISCAIYILNKANKLIDKLYILCYGILPFLILFVLFLLSLFYNFFIK